jgi:peptidoglycan/LPS O-acetylase OafA/YrhL
LEYRPDIDGLRAVAALAVVGRHAGLLPGGAAGVDIFFVISGFLISKIIFRALERGSFSFYDFYAGRIKRIFPALIALLVAMWGIGWFMLLPSEFERLGNDIAAGAGFSENLLFVFYVTYAQRTKASDFLLTHLWTLGIEEQFYLLWPIFLCATWRLGSGLFFLIAVTVTMSFASYALMLSRDPAAWLLPWNRLWELSLGGALAYVQLGGLAERNRMRVSSAVVRLLGLSRLPRGHYLGTIGAAFLIASLVGFGPSTAWPGWRTLMPSIGALLLISAGPQCWLNRYVLGARPMVFIGLLSYRKRLILLTITHNFLMNLPDKVEVHAGFCDTHYPHHVLHGMDSTHDEVARARRLGRSRAGRMSVQGRAIGKAFPEAARTVVRGNGREHSDGLSGLGEYQGGVSIFLQRARE